MIIRKDRLIKLLKGFEIHLKGIDCLDYYIDITIIGIDKEFALHADGIQKLIEDKNA